MKRADLSGGLFVAGAHQVDLIDSTGVVVAQAPRGIHTQAYDADWKRIAPFLASSTKMLKELQQLALFAESCGRDVSAARRLIANAVQHVPELKSVLDDERTRSVQSPVRVAAATTDPGARRAMSPALRPSGTHTGHFQPDHEATVVDGAVGCAP